MKNIHILITDQPSRLACDFDKLILNSRLLSPILYKTQNIYITSDEKIKEGDWHFNLALNLVEKTTSFHNGLLCEKIILTTDQDLIKNGVQEIDKIFLGWFVKNPSCVRVEVEKESHIEIEEVSYEGDFQNVEYISYKIIIPQEEPKQEKLEETTEINLTRLCYYDKRNPDFQIKEEYGYDKEEVEATGNFSKKDCACDNCFYGRSKLTEQLIWQKKRMYSEEEVFEIIAFFVNDAPHNTKEWFEQFKKK